MSAAAAVRSALPLVLGLVLLLPEAEASVCTTQTRGDLLCDGRVKSGLIRQSGQNSITTYTCDETDAGGNLPSHNGPDAIYRLVCPYTGVVSLRVESDCEVDAFVLDSCAGSDCLYGYDEAGDSRTIEVDCVQGNETWVVLEAWNLINGPLLRWCGPLGQITAAYDAWLECTEDCGDGQDDDHDGDIDLNDADCCDLDGDGYDATAALNPVCSGTDCDDDDAAIRPGATDIPGNGIDENCNGKDLCYADNDGDLYGSTQTIAGLDMSCNDPGRVANSSDCNDTLASVNPAASEVTGNGIDENCNGQETCFDDDDNDGFLDTTNDTRNSLDVDCLDANEGTSTDPRTDCNDSSAAFNPNATEICNGLDDDCDGLIDDNDPNLTGGTLWYRDVDNDGAAGSASTLRKCVQPVGYYASATDCNDSSNLIYPGATEVPADGIDQDCNSADHCYTDADRDTFGSTVTFSGNDLICGNVAGESAVRTDCNDGAAAVNPNATEICNAIDDDCDTQIDDADTSRSGGTTWYQDADSDGHAGSATTVQRCVQPVGFFASATDCDDANRNAYPSAAETPADAIDQDCNGVDSCYVDADRDSFGGASVAAGNDMTCGNLAGESATSNDCVDNNNQIFPGQAEICDGVDNDCDTLKDDADPGRVGGTVFYTDVDGDGFAGSGTTILACQLPPGAFTQAQDCLDQAGAGLAFYPGAPEVAADGLDQDCDGTDHCYVDQDRDGFGTAFAAPGNNLTCGDVSGESARADDCRDSGAGAASVFPGAPETCNGFDDDCDTLVDDADADRTGGSTWYLDADLDGFAGSSSTTQSCAAPAGYYASAADCLDTGPLARSFYPGAPEVAADGLDQDCDLKDHCFVDQDSDGFGSALTAAGNDMTCGNLPGESARGDDCADVGAGSQAIFPGAPEICNAFDDDCDLLVDDADPERTGGSTWYQDADNDGYAGSATTVLSCQQPAGYFATAADCLDQGPLAPSFYPGAVDLPADGLDQDCDTADHCYVDSDGDGFGSALTAAGNDMTCGNLTGESARGDDCVDEGLGALAVFPGAPEVCNGFDDDCDTLVDDADPQRTGGSVWFFDSDGDGFAGSTVTTQACAQPENYAAAPIDCLDSGPLGPSFYPGAAEVPADGLDQDCDTVDHCWVDLDGDGYGGGASAAGDNLVCGDQAGESDSDEDCQDVGEGAVDVYPGAAEVCNGVDDDCDLLLDDADPGRAGGEVWYFDQDGDGYAGDALTSNACAQPVGYYPEPADCLDVGPLALQFYPGATEVVADGLDQDCDAVDHCWTDLDGDGFGGANAGPGNNLVCGDIPGESATQNDCLDQGAGARLVNPAASETCNGYDDDCDTLIDDGDPSRSGGSVWYLDADGDGFAGSATTSQSCTAGFGYYATANDCRDQGPDAPLFYPGAPEVPADGLDQDCDNADHCWVDLDLDGYGARTAAAGDNRVCGDRPGESVRSDDCLDEGPGAPRVFPGASETCNGYDDDCDLLVDDADANVTGAPTWYRDGDGDGHAGAGAGIARCVAPAGSYATTSDCDDARADIGPDAPEVCNGYDDDCDLLIDDADTLLGTVLVWRDADGDGFGDPAAPREVATCSTPPGAADNDDDCDDRDLASYPGGEEVPYDQVDQDCDGADLIDIDGDGYAGGGFGDDCVDVVPAIRPGQLERADGVDEDCDGIVDEGTSRFDDDGDGVAEDGGDCDDASLAVRPGAVETCDGADEDCDGRIDEETDCADDDQDGFTERQGDCNDANPDLHPGADELGGNGVDNDCDGVIVSGDADGDGYAPWGGDCNDADVAVRPGAIELANGLDDDCDAATDESTTVADDDRDGFAESAGDCNDAEPLVNPGAVEQTGNRRDDDCDGVVDEGGPQIDDDGDGFTEDAGDCDDGDATVRPYGEEIDDQRDNDCDGQVDDGVGDLDGDGWTEEGGDCDDRDGYANPEMDEACDGADNDCDDDVDEGCEDRLPEPTTDKDIGTEGGCSCDQRGAPTGGLLAGLLGLLGWRRRRT